MKIKSKLLYYVLSVTWGLPLTLLGAIIALVLIATKHKPKRYGGCWYFAVGKTNWGGLELGLFFLCDKSESEYIRNHEFGHGIQNCYFGFLMPFIVTIPSAIRYHYREHLVRSGKKSWSELPDYDSVWFEGQATRLGEEHMRLWGEITDD